jgi:hypothetical protein
MGQSKANGGSIGGLGKLAQGIAQLAIRIPGCLCSFLQQYADTSEEMASIGGIGSNIVPERQQAYEALKGKPGKDFFTDEQIQRKIQEMGLEPEQRAQSVKRPQATAQGKVLLDWMGPMFNKLESLYQLPAGLLKSVAITESGGNQFAMSGAGAKVCSSLWMARRATWACVGMMYSTRKSQLRQPLSTLASCCGRTAETLAKHWHHITGGSATFSAMAWG